MKRKLITIFITLIMLNSLLVGGGTYAFFTARTDNQFEEFQTGSIDIESSSTESPSTLRALGFNALMPTPSCQTIQFPMFYGYANYPTGPNPYDKTVYPPSGEIPGGWAPGEAVTRFWSINNLGSSAKMTQISAELVSITGPNGAISPGTQAYADFLNYMKMTVYSPEDGYRNPVFDGTFHKLLSGKQPLNTIMYLSKGCKGYKAMFVASMDSDAGNNLQGVKGVLNFTLSAEQTNHNCFDPPFSNWNYSMQKGSTTPIKFECYDLDGNFIRSSQDVRLVISGRNFSHTYTLGNGLSCNGGHYQANVYEVENQLIDGVTYTATVYNGSHIYNQKTFTTIPGNRSNSQ